MSPQLGGGSAGPVPTVPGSRGGAAPSSLCCYLLINHTPPPLNRGQASIRDGVLGPICRKTPPGMGTRLGGAGEGALGVPSGDKMGTEGTKWGQRGQNGDRGDPGHPEVGSAWRGIPKGWLGARIAAQTPNPCPPWAVGWRRWCPRSPPVLQRRRQALLSAGTKEPKRGRYRANKHGERPGGAVVGWQLHGERGGTDPIPHPGAGRGPPRAPRCRPRVCQRCLTPWGCPQGPHPLQGAPPARVGVGQEEPEPKLSC